MPKKPPSSPRKPSNLSLPKSASTSTLSGPPTPGAPPAILSPPPSGPRTFSDNLPLPKLIIFDLDYTLWPFWIDTHAVPPLKGKDGGGKAVDRCGESFAFYKDIPAILRSAEKAAITLSLASRTQAPDLAVQLLKLLTISFPPSSTTHSSKTASSASNKTTPPPSASPKRALDFFTHVQIYPGDKKKHMERLKEKTGIGYEDMLFFDDEVRNRNVEVLGVTMWLVRDGVGIGEVDAGVEEWRRRRVVRR